MRELGFDEEQLAAALERVVFEEDDVDEAMRNAATLGSAEVGMFPFQGQAQYSIHPVLALREGGLQLCVCVFDNDHPAQDDPAMHPDFTVVLRTAAGEVLTSKRDSWDGGTPLEVIPLSDSSQLVGAKLEFVA
jgi:hypothetical protein